MQRFLRLWFSGCSVAPRNLGFWWILQRFPYRWSLYEALWAALLPGWQRRLRCHLHWHIALNTEGAAWDTSVLGGTCGGFWGAGVSAGWRRGWMEKRKGAFLSWELAPCPFPPGSLRVPGCGRTFQSALLDSKHLARVQNSVVFLTSEIWLSACENIIKLLWLGP